MEMILARGSGDSRGQGPKGGRNGPNAVGELRFVRSVAPIARSSFRMGASVHDRRQAPQRSANRSIGKSHPGEAQIQPLVVDDQIPRQPLNIALAGLTSGASPGHSDQNPGGARAAFGGRRQEAFVEPRWMNGPACFPGAWAFSARTANAGQGWQMPAASGTTGKCRLRMARPAPVANANERVESWSRD